MLEKEHSKELSGYFHTSNVTIRISKCHTDSLVVKSHCNPAINGDSNNGYAIYEKQTSPVIISSYVEKNKTAYVSDELEFIGQKYIKHINLT